LVCLLRTPSGGQQDGDGEPLLHVEDGALTECLGQRDPRRAARPFRGSRSGKGIGMLNHDHHDGSGGLDGHPLQSAGRSPRPASAAFHLSWPALAVITALYVTATELTKRRFYRPSNLMPG
jgi:hypothetical protein